MFANHAEIKNFLCGCFSFIHAKQIRKHIDKHYVKGDFGGLFSNSGDLHIPFEAFKRDLLGAFKGNDWELQKAFCKLQPYLVGEILLFEITKDTNTPQRFLSKDSVENICKTLKQ